MCVNMLDHSILSFLLLYVSDFMRISLLQER